MSAPRILLHGFSGSPDAWAPVRAAWEGDVTSIALPLLGHAEELVRGPEERFDDEVERLAEQITRQGSPPVDLIGYSLGGRIALGLLVARPDLVRRAALIGANPGIDDPRVRAERAEGDARWVALLETKGLSAFVERWENVPLFETQQALPPHILLRQREQRLTHDASGLARSLRVTGLSAMPSYWGALETLPMPVTWIAGELDAKFRELAERASRACPSGRMLLIEGSGHNVVLEQPERLAMALDEVLR